MTFIHNLNPRKPTQPRSTQHARNTHKMYFTIQFRNPITRNIIHAHVTYHKHITRAPRNTHSGLYIHKESMNDDTVGRKRLIEELFGSDDEDEGSKNTDGEVCSLPLYSLLSVPQSLISARGE